MRIVLLAMLWLAYGLTLLAEDQKPAIVEFVSKEGGFSATFPQAPKESPPDAQLGQHQFTVETRDGALVASYQDNPGLRGAADDVLAKGLNDAQESVRAGFQGNMIKSQAIKLAEEYPGLDYECDIPAAGGLYRSRSYLINGRMYQLIAVGTKDFAFSATANTFLGSLKLLPK